MILNLLCRGLMVCFVFGESKMNLYAFMELDFYFSCF